MQIEEMIPYLCLLHNKTGRNEIIFLNVCKSMNDYSELRHNQFISPVFFFQLVLASLPSFVGPQLRHTVQPFGQQPATLDEGS